MWWGFRRSIVPTADPDTTNRPILPSQRAADAPATARDVGQRPHGRQGQLLHGLPGHARDDSIEVNGHLLPQLCVLPHLKRVGQAQQHSAVAVRRQGQQVHVGRQAGRTGARGRRGRSFQPHPLPFILGQQSQDQRMGGTSLGSPPRRRHVVPRRSQHQTVPAHRHQPPAAAVGAAALGLV